MDADVTHQAQGSRAQTLGGDAVATHSSYEVALFNIHFDQPAFFKGIPLPDLATFLSQQHSHHRIFDDAVRLICEAPTETSSTTPPTKPTVVSTDPMALPHSLGDDVYLVPLDAGYRSRYQWLRAVAETNTLEPTVGYVNWNRISFALLTRSWVGKKAPPRQPSNGAGSLGSDATSSTMAQLIRETSGMSQIHDSLSNTFNPKIGKRHRRGKQGDGQIDESDDESMDSINSNANNGGGVERHKLIQRTHFDPSLLRKGLCRLEFLPPHTPQLRITAPISSASSSPSPSSPSSSLTASFTTRKGIPFAGSVKLQPLSPIPSSSASSSPSPSPSTSQLNTTSPSSTSSSLISYAEGIPSSGRVHLVHEHDNELSFLAHSVDIHGQSSTGIPFLSILLSPIVDFIKEQIGRRTPDYIKWRIRTDLFKRLVQQVVSSELFNTVADNDHHLSILTELRSQATKEMTDSHHYNDNTGTASGGMSSKAQGPNEFDRYRFSQIKTGIGSYMTLNQMMKTEGGVSNPDQTMLKPDGCLTNPIIHHMIITLSRVLPVTITEKVVTDQHDAVANIIAPSLLEYLVPTIIDSLPNSVVPMVAMTLNYAIPPIVKRLVPLQVIKHVTTAVTDTITRGVVHIVAPTLSHTLRDAARIEPVCYYCYYVDPRYCYICPKNRPLPASSQAHIDLYTIDFFVDYYTDYYADFYTGKKPLTSAAVKQAEG